MATKSFAIPLDASSKQEGDITFEAMKNAGSSAEFQLTYVVSGQSNDLVLKTKKNGAVTDHVFYPTVSGGTATVTLSKDDIAAIFTDASGGEWDYVGAHWTVGAVDSGGTSEQYEVQGGSVYDGNRWPPKN
ncbi:MAG: hypothetical protein ACOZB3_00150 [Calditrichota bacterium]